MISEYSRYNENESIEDLVPNVDPTSNKFNKFDVSLAHERLSREPAFLGQKERNVKVEVKVEKYTEELPAEDNNRIDRYRAERKENVW